jgi:hypothetical protein
MQQYKKYFILGALVVLVLAGLLFISYGNYPIAIVNGSFISAQTYLKDYRALSLFNANLLKISPPSSDVISTTPDEIARQTMDQLVENALVEQAAKKEAGGDFSALVGEKVDEAANKPQLESAAKTLYGLDIEDFKNEVLRPQAVRDILTGRLFLKGQNIDEWLAAEKKSARVIFFSGRFRWDGDHVELK